MLVLKRLRADEANVSTIENEPSLCVETAQLITKITTIDLYPEVIYLDLIQPLH